MRAVEIKGKSLGSILKWQRLTERYMIASVISRTYVLGGRLQNRLSGFDGVPQLR